VRQLFDLAQENIAMFDGFAGGLAQKNNSLVHFLLSNPTHDLAVQMFL